MVTEARVREALSAVADPEMPVLTLTDLGILRDVSVDGATVTVTITPTYSGCPAMQEITQDITRAVLACGGEHVFVRTILSPAWTTDWISEEGRRKLEAYGIAPPPPGPRLRCWCRSDEGTSPPAPAAPRPTPRSCPGSPRPRAGPCGGAGPAVSRSTT